MNFKEWQRASGRVPDTTKSPRGFVVGDRVILPPMPENDLPEQRGVIISINEQWPASDERSINNEMIVVEIDEQYRDEDDYDGLTELGDSHCEKE